MSCFERVVELLNGLLGIVGLVEQRYEFGTDDGAGGMLASRCQRLPIADAEAYHARIAKVHVVDALEVSLFLFIEFFLCAGGSG